MLQLTKIAQLLRLSTAPKQPHPQPRRGPRQSARPVLMEAMEPRLLLSVTLPGVDEAVDPTTVAAAVVTDKLDYAPSETALITAFNGTAEGAKYLAGELVRFRVTRTDGIDDFPMGNVPWFVTDGVGGFDPYQQYDEGVAVDRDVDGIADWMFPDMDMTVNASVDTSWFVETQYLGASLLLTAAGETSGASASTEFTDSALATAVITPSTVVGGTTNTFTLTVSNTSTGPSPNPNMGSFTVNVPTGMTYTNATATVASVNDPGNLTPSWVFDTFDSVTGNLKFQALNTASEVNPTTGFVTITFQATASSSAGSRTFTTAAFANRNYGGGSFSIPAQPVVTVTAANTAPTVASPIPDVAVSEDAANTTVDLNAAFADAETPDASLVYSITSNSNTGLFASTSISAGLLTLDYAPQANGSATIVVRATDLGGLWIEDSFNVNVNSVNDAPVALADAYSVNEDGVLTVAAAGVLANDSDPNDSPANVLSATLVDNVDNGTLVLNANGSFTYTPAANFNGTDSFTYAVSDNGGTAFGGDDTGNTVTVTLTVNSVNDAPVVSFIIWDGDEAIQYSDGPPAVSPWKIAVTDIDSPLSSLVFSGLPGGITATSSDAGMIRTYTLAGAVTAAPNPYNLTVSDTVAPAVAAGKITVTQEDARTTYTGLMYASTASASSGQATVLLAATIQDITATADAAGDLAFGDIRKATVTFVDRDNGNAVIATVPVALVNIADTKTGTASFSWNVDIGAATSKSFTVGVIVNNYYTRNASTDNTVVTVSKPTAGSINGGGYLVNTASNGTYAGAAGANTNFGLNVKFNKQATNLQGNTNIIVRAADGRVYQIKSNAIDSLNISPVSGGTAATFTSKANVTDITNPLSPISKGGGKLLQIQMTDKGEPGVNDTIAITLYDSANNGGGVLFSSSWSGTNTVQQLLKGGNLQVRPALMLDGLAQSSVGSTDLTLSQVQPMFNAAKAAWLATGLSAEQSQALAQLTVQTDSLSDSELGWQSANVITLDADAAGHGWFIDATPGDNSEFSSSSLFANNGAAAGRMDMLSVLLHEVGHAIGMDHSSSGVMGEALQPGQRSLLAPLASTAGTAPRAPAWLGYDTPSVVRQADVDAAAPVIDWSVKKSDARRAAPSDASAPSKRWVGDFVNHAGATAEQRNPNLGLKVSAGASVVLGRPLRSL